LIAICSAASQVDKGQVFEPRRDQLMTDIGARSYRTALR